MGVVMINSGWDNLVENNVFIDCPMTLTAHARWKEGNVEELERYISAEGLWTVRLTKSVKHTVPPYSLRYPELAGFFETDLTQPSGNRLARNVFYDLGSIIRETREPKVVVENNFQTETDPGFVDAANMNFQLKDDSIAYEKIPGFEKIPFEKIGLYKDKYRSAISE